MTQTEPCLEGEGWELWQNPMWIWRHDHQGPTGVPTALTSEQTDEDFWANPRDHLANFPNEMGIFPLNKSMVTKSVLEGIHVQKESPTIQIRKPSGCAWNYKVHKLNVTCDCRVKSHRGLPDTSHSCTVPCCNCSVGKQSPCMGFGIWAWWVDI